MENSFPCKECLVRVCCKEYCDQLISNSRTLSLYIRLYNVCPDCGTDLNENGFVSSSVVLCFECKKAFRSDIMIKSNNQKTNVLVGYPPNITFDVSLYPTIITDIKTSPLETSQPPPMEETHDVVLSRLPEGEAIYVINKHIYNINREKIMAKTYQKRRSITKILQVEKTRLPRIEELPEWARTDELLIYDSPEDKEAPYLIINNNMLYI